MQPVTLHIGLLLLILLLRDYLLKDIYLFVHRSPTGVPTTDQKTGRLSWQRGNSQPSSPRSCNFAYVSESPFLFVFVRRNPHNPFTRARLFEMGEVSA